MSVKEWEDKYEHILNLAQELYETCPFNGNHRPDCNNCAIRNKCNNIYYIFEILNRY